MFFLENLDYREPDATNETNGFSPQYCTIKYYFLNWVHDGGIWTCTGWGRQVWKWRERKRSSTFRKFRTVKTLVQGTQIDNCPVEIFSTTEKFSIPTLIEEMKPVVLMKYEFEWRERLINRIFSLKVWTIRTLKQKRKQWFLFEYSSKNAVFPVEILMEEIE